MYVFWQRLNDDRSKLHYASVLLTLGNARVDTNDEIASEVINDYHSKVLLQWDRVRVITVRKMDSALQCRVDIDWCALGNRCSFDYSWAETCETSEWGTWWSASCNCEVFGQTVSSVRWLHQIESTDVCTFEWRGWTIRGAVMGVSGQP